MVDPSLTPYDHCISRCVRQAYLCGRDRHTGRNFDHRKQWVVERIHQLAAVFAIDVCAYAVMSNHFHLVLRLDRRRAAGWSEEEVCRRYGELFPRAVRLAAGLDRRSRREKVRLWRERLCDLSWYMRALNEYIARRANREEGGHGRFWEGRFRSQALLDERAVLACMSYVDLNPVRAGVVRRVRQARLTSIWERLREAGGRRVRGNLVPFAGERGAGAPEPLELSMGLEDYVVLLEDLAGAIGEERELAEGNRERLRRMGLRPGEFVRSVRDLGRTFFTMIGHVHRIEVAVRRRGQRHCPGISAARRLYDQAA